MLEHHEDDPSQNLLDEELSKDELSEVLERLGRRELGGSENSTIRDVAEATSADPQAIGRILADVRKENFEEKYGLKIEEHEERIERLEKRPSPRDSYRPGPQESPAERIIAKHRDILDELGTDDRDELLNMVEERRRNRTLTYIMIPIILVFAIVGAVVSGTRGHVSAPYSQAYPSAITIHDVEITGFPNGPWKAKDHGQTRPATNEEVSNALSSWAAIRESESGRR